MARSCATCQHPQRDTINQKIRSGVALVDVARWLSTTDAPIGRNALSRHLPHIGAAPRRPGLRPISGDLLETIRDRVSERIADGELEPNVKEGIAAVKAIDARLARNADRDLMAKIALILSGAQDIPYLADPETAAIEGEFRELLAPQAGAE